MPYISIDSLVLETDAPYLAPTPHRGKRNEVAYIDLVADRVALLMTVTKEEVVLRTKENALALMP